MKVYIDSREQMDRKQHKCFKRRNSLVNYGIATENRIGIRNYGVAQEKETCL